MPCCHVDFAFNESSDKAFTIGMPTFTFGAGCLAEAGQQARELSLRRVALFTDRGVAASPHLGVVRDALAATGVDAIVYDEVSVEPTTASFKAAAKFAAEGRFDGYVSVGGGSVIDTCKAANLYASHPADFMSYVNAPIGGGQKVPGPVKPHIACPTTCGTGSETTGIAIFNMTEINAKTGIISRRLIPTIALVDPDVTATLPRNVVAASGFDCMSHALEALTARPWPRRLNPARGVGRPVSQGANPFSDALAAEALKGVGKFLVRAVNDARRCRGAHRDDVRRDDGRHRLQRRGLPPAAWTLVCGIGTRARFRAPRVSEGEDAGPARHGGRAQQSFGVALYGAVQSRAPRSRRRVSGHGHARTD